MSECMSERSCESCVNAKRSIGSMPCSVCSVTPGHPAWEKKSCDNCKHKTVLSTEYPCNWCIVKGHKEGWEEVHATTYKCTLSAPIIETIKTPLSAVDMALLYEKYRERDRNIMRTGSMISLRPKKIITNGPATIVFWSDDTKTIVKCAEGEHQDVYIAFTAALAKKVFGSNSRLKKSIKKCLVEQNG